MIYLDGKSGRSLAKRFQVLAVTRDKEYNLTKGNKGSKVLYLTGNPNAEAELVTVYLTSGAKARKKVFDFDFAGLDIKGRGAGGNILTRYPVRKVVLKSEGISTMGGLDIWYDETVGRLNRDQRGKFLGKFHGDDRVVAIYKDGTYELTDFELTNRYEPEKVVCVDKVSEDTIITAVHYDSATKSHYVKRFQIETSTLGKRFSFISEAPGSKLTAAETNQQHMLEYDFRDSKSRKTSSKQVDPKTMIDVKGWKANGNRLSSHKVVKVRFITGQSSEPVTEEFEQVDQPKSDVPRDSVVKESSKKKSKKPGKASEKDATSSAPAGDSGFQVGATIEFDVPSQDQQEQLGLFQSPNDN